MREWDPKENAHSHVANALQLLKWEEFSEPTRTACIERLERAMWLLEREEYRRRAVWDSEARQSGAV